MLFDYSQVYSEMDDTVAYIRELLSVVPEQNLLEKNPENEAPLILEEDLEKLGFAQIERASAAFNSCALDGGQGTVIRSGVLLVGVYRAGYKVYRSRKLMREYIRPLILVNLSPANYRDIYKKLYEELLEGLPVDYPSYAESHRWIRSIYEESCRRMALGELREGDLLLLDGALGERQTSRKKALRQFLSEAQSKGINVAAVSKSCSLLWRCGANLIGVIKKVGDNKSADRSWYVKVSRESQEEMDESYSEVFVAKLNRFSQLAFRVDLSRFNVTPASGLFSQLSELSADPSFVGYPYPLAAVHRAVRLSPDELLHLSRRLREKAHVAGITGTEWKTMFGDYHCTLNRDYIGSGRLVRTLPNAFLHGGAWDA